ncbi:MAG: hypothetical protein IJH34_15665 [Romboutsia sp.]|nr:hypothetical protein [Romboutsia sp.]
MYLVDAIIDDYDVIIIDSNSSISHVTTYPLLKMANTCYYILNLDFNNIRNNTRYRSTLKELGITDKVKYILNQDIKNDSNGAHSGTNIETLLFTANHLDDSGFKLEATIPAIPQTVFLNRLYEGKPIILDDKDYTKNVRHELLKICNQIWPIEGFEEVKENNSSNVQNKNKNKKVSIFNKKR